MGDLHQDNIDDLFRDGLSAAERMPALAVWEKIATELDNDKRRRLLLWWKPITIAAAMLLATLGLWLTRTNVHSASSTASTGEASTVFNRPIPAERPVAQPSSLNSAPIMAEVTMHSARTLMLATGLVPARLLATGLAPASPSLATQPAESVTAPPGTSSAGRGIPLSLVPVAARSDPQIRTLLSPGHSMPGGLTRLNVRQHRLDLTLYASQELAGYNLADHDSTGAHGQEIEKRQSTNFSRSAGFLFSYHLRHHWTVQSGLSLSQSYTISHPGKVVATLDNNGMTSFQVNTITGYGYVAADGIANVGDSATTGKVTGRLDYVTLPIIVSREWSIGRCTFLAGSGLDAKLLTHATIKTSITGPAGSGRQKQVTQYGLRKVDFGWQVKGECRYQLSRDYSAMLMVTFKSSVGPVNVHTSYSSYPYNLGIGLGITRTF